MHNYLWESDPLSLILQGMNIVSTAFSVCMCKCVLLFLKLSSRNSLSIFSYYRKLKVINTDTCFVDNLDRDSLFHQERSSEVCSGMWMLYSGAGALTYASIIQPSALCLPTFLGSSFRKASYSAHYPPYFYAMPKVTITHCRKNYVWNSKKNHQAVNVCRLRGSCL